MMAGCENGNNSVSTRYVPCSGDDMQQVSTKADIIATEESIDYSYTGEVLKLIHNFTVWCGTDDCSIGCNVTGNRIEITERPTGTSIDTGCTCLSQAIVELSVPKQRYDIEIHIYTRDVETGVESLWMTQKYTIDLNESTSGEAFITNYDPILEESQTIDENLLGIWECVQIEIPGSPENPYLPGDEGFNEKTLTLDGEWNFTETTANGTDGGQYAIGSYSYEDPKTNSMTDGGSYLQLNYQSGCNSINIYKVDADTLWTYPEPLTTGGATFKYVKQTNN